MQQLFMKQLVLNKQTLLNHVAQIVEQLMITRPKYQERLDLTEIQAMIVAQFDKFSVDELAAIPDDELLKRINSIMMLQAVAGTLNDFTPEEMRIYDEAVTGRSIK